MAAPKERFAQQVKDALAHLYDITELPRLDLTHHMVQDETLGWDERAQRARRLLIDAIEQLNPGDTFAFHARERRSYALLVNRYVRSMTSQEVIEELVISERQYWREHQRAISTLVDVLWERYGEGGAKKVAPEEEETTSTLVRAEVEHLVTHSEVGELDLREVAREVVASIHKITESRQLTLVMLLPESPIRVMANRIVIRQIYLNLLSYATDITGDRHIHLELTMEGESVRVAITTAIQSATPPSDDPHALKLAISQQLAASQQGEIVVESDTGRWSASVELPKLQELAVLVVDDNAAAIKLFQRYLANSKYRVTGAQTGSEALRLAKQTHPAVITLDVMMPNQDGWEVLQTLKSTPALAKTPIIICSVLNEPELAYSLGANDFLRKPVTRDALLQMLDRWSAVRRSARSRYA